MEPADDKNWASKYLLDPLNEPEPSAVTGPGTHFRSTVAPVSSNKEAKSKQPITSVREVDNSSLPPHSASLRKSHLASAKAEENVSRASSEIPTSSSKSSIHHSSIAQDNTGRRRGSSLRERFEGDELSRPLDVIRRSSLRAQRSPHLRKDHHHGLDSIDRLAAIDDAYHLGGPFDAVSRAKNISSRDSPVAALKHSNAEALRATPREAIIDSLRHHRPLDNIAVLPPGVPDRSGRVLNYREGNNMQKGTSSEDELNRYPAYNDYLQPEHKSKSSHEKHRRAISDTYEMTNRPRSNLNPNNPFNARNRAVSGAATSAREQPYTEWQSDLERSKSAKGGFVSRKLGSLRRRHHSEANE